MLNVPVSQLLITNTSLPAWIATPQLQNMPLLPQRVVLICTYLIRKTIAGCVSSDVHDDGECGSDTFRLLLDQLNIIYVNIKFSFYVHL